MIVRHIVSGVSVPNPDPKTDAERKQQINIDIQTASIGKAEVSDTSVKHTASRNCDIDLKTKIDKDIWKDDVQRALRKAYNVPNLPLVTQWDASGYMTYLLLIPPEARIVKKSGKFYLM